MSSSCLLQTGTGLWSPDGLPERSALWVSQVWQQLNACLTRLGTHEALLGPQLFLSCPVAPSNTQAVLRCVSRYRFYYQNKSLSVSEGSGRGQEKCDSKENIWRRCYLGDT